MHHADLATSFPVAGLHTMVSYDCMCWKMYKFTSGLIAAKKSIPCKEWKGEELRYSSNGRESREKKPNSLGCRKNSVFHSDNLSQIWLCLRIVQLCNAFASLCSFGLCECRFLLFFLSLVYLFVCWVCLNPVCPLFFHWLSVFQQFLNLKCFVNARLPKQKTHTNPTKSRTMPKRLLVNASFHTASMCFLFVYSAEIDSEEQKKTGIFCVCSIRFFCVCRGMMCFAQIARVGDRTKRKERERVKKYEPNASVLCVFV